MTQQSPLPRTSPSLKSQPPNQQTLIYDLHSQLSSLKKQFSKLLCKPNQPPSNSKNETYKYNHTNNNHNKQTIPITNTVQSNQVLVKTPENINILNTKTNQNTIRNIYIAPQRLNKSNYIKIADSSEYLTNSLKVNQTKYPDTSSTSPSKTNTNNQPSNENSAKKQKYSNGLTQNNRKITTNCIRIIDKNHQQTNNKIHYFTQQSEYTARNPQQITKIQLDHRFQTAKTTKNILNPIDHTTNPLKSHIKTQDDKIPKLQSTILSLTQSLNKQQQQHQQFQLQKNQQLQNLINQHHTQLEKQKNMYENKIINNRYIADQEIRKIKYHHQCQLGENTKIREELLQKYQIQNNKILQLNNKILQLDKQKQSIQHTADSLKNQLTKLKQQNKSLIAKHLKQPNNKQKYIKQAPPPSPSPQQKFKQPQHSTLQQQNKHLQDKLTTYLNNIDKLSQRLKQQKNDLETNQKSIETQNKIITQQQSVIRNLMHNIKNIQKDLLQNKKNVKNLQSLLSDANQFINKLILQHINNKYSKIGR